MTPWILGYWYIVREDGFIAIIFPAYLNGQWYLHIENITVDLETLSDLLPLSYEADEDSVIHMSCQLIAENTLLGMDGMVGFIPVYTLDKDTQEEKQAMLTRIIEAQLERIHLNG